MFFSSKKIQQLNAVLERDLSPQVQDQKQAECKDSWLDSFLRVVKLIKRSQPSERASTPDVSFKSRLLNNLLSWRRSRSTPMPESKISTPFNLFDWFDQHKRFSHVLTVVVLITLISTSLYVFRGREGVVPSALAYDKFTVTASSSDSLGMNADGYFIVDSQEAIEKDFVEQNIKIEPAMVYNIAKVNSKRYLIQPAQPLIANSIYSVSLHTNDNITSDYSWAFQVKNKFRIVGTLPADESNMVPTTTGIEVYFTHDNWDIKDFQNNFTIDPRVDGRFEKHKRTAVFIPKELQPKTIYSVSVKKSLALSGSKDRLMDDVVFRFETANTGVTARGEYFNFYDDEMIWNSLTAPSVAFTSQGYDLNTMSIDVFRFPSTAAYISAIQLKEQFPTWAVESRESKLIPLTNLSKIFDFQPKVEQIEDYRSSYLSLPERLDHGFYLLQTQLGSMVYQMLLQITDIAVFVTVSETKTLIWVNDVTTDAPISGAHVRLLKSDMEAETGSDGVVFITTPSTFLDLSLSEKDFYLEVIANQQTTLIRVDTSGGGISDGIGGWFGCCFNAGSPEKDAYWRYLYIDRPVYQPTDTVEFWGMLKKRDQQSMRETVKVSLYKNDFSYYDSGLPRPLWTSNLQLSDMGTFIGKTSLTNFSPGWYELAIELPSGRLTTRSFEVQTYVKPLFQILAKPEKDHIFYDEDQKVKITSKFFDGTVFPHLELEYRVEGHRGVAIPLGTLTTDAFGKAEVVVPRNSYSDGGFDAQGYVTLSLYPKLLEKSDMEVETSWQVYYAHHAITAREKLSEKEMTIGAKVYDVDLSKVNQPRETTNQESFFPMRDYFGNPRENASVKGSVLRIDWKKVEHGEHYDFINKKVVKEYFWQDIETLVAKFDGVTNTQGEYYFTMPYEKNVSYMIKVHTQDVNGKTSSQELHVSGVYEKVDPNPSGWFNVWAQDDTRDRVFDIGETAHIRLQKGATELLPKSTANYLYFTAQRGLRAFTVSDTPKLDIVFAETMIPNISVGAVYFNGTYYEVSLPDDGFGTGGGSVMKFNTKQKELQISVATSKEQYLPGESADLFVEVKDQEGKPVEAEVSFSLVDEALFSFMDYENRHDPLDTLYTNVGAGILWSLWSHREPTMYGGAEKGGGPGGGSRSDFRDTAFFGSLRTGSDGKGKMNFTLPDNITTFRVTTQAITNSLQAGRALGEVVISKPLFVEASLADEYVVSDKPIIRVRAFGDALQPGQEVEYSLKIENLKFEKVMKGPAMTGVDIALPELKVGRHEVLYSAKVGFESDTVEESVMVVVSRVQRPVTQFFPVTDKLSLPDADGLVTLLFTNESLGKYYQPLQELNWAYGQRIDQILPSKLAQELLKQYFDEASTAQEVKFTDYQRYEGCVTMLTYSNCDLKLSVFSAVTAQDRFDASGLMKYFYSILDDRNQQQMVDGQGQYEGENPDLSFVVRALAGLAALHEPVLNDLLAMSQNDHLNTLDRFYVILGLTEIGAQQEAKRLYSDLIQKSVESKGNFWRISVGVDQDDVLLATSLAAALGVQFADERASAMWKYAEENDTNDILVNFERLLFLQKALPMSGTTNEVSLDYTMGDESRSITLDPGRTVGVTMNSVDAEKMKFTNIKGQVGVIFTAIKPADYQTLKRDPDLKVHREYTVGAAKTYAFVETDVVRVDISLSFGPKAADGQYELMDFVPSGLRIMPDPNHRLGQNDPQTFNASYPSMIDGQKVKFYAGDYEYGRKVTYYARVINRGEFLAEPALLYKSDDSQILNLSEPQTVRVK